MDEVSHLKSAGIDFGAPQVNIDTLRGHKEKVIGKLTGGLAQMAKMRKVTVLRGYGHFVGANHLEVEETTGTSQDKTGAKKVVAFKRAIIAAGSQAVRLPFMPDDPRVVDSTGALALQGVPKRMLILGGGIIGLEMGTVYSTLGARLDVVEMMDGLMQGADRDLVKVWQKMNAHRVDNIMLNTKTVAAEATPEGIKVSFAPAKDGVTVPEPQVYDLVLQAGGRTPNGKKIAADKAGVAVTDTPAVSAASVLPVGVRPTACSTRSYTCGAGSVPPSSAGANVTSMPSGVALAPTVLVLSMMLSKRLAFIFCQILTRSRSAPCIRPSIISTTSRRAPSVLYTVPISRPMMPPPRMSMRLGTPCSASAPVESTTRGSSGMKGRRTAWLPAAMMAFWKATNSMPRLLQP